VVVLLVDVVDVVDVVDTVLVVLAVDAVVEDDVVVVVVVVVVMDSNVPLVTVKLSKLHSAVGSLFPLRISMRTVTLPAAGTCVSGPRIIFH